MVKERKDFVSEIVAETRQSDTRSTDVTASVSAGSNSDEGESDGPSLPADQPVIKGHGEPNQRQKELDPNEVNPKEVHHVVVPYSQLMYQRMYDWPPEPKYARVRIPPPKPPPSTRKTTSPASMRRTSFFTSSESLLGGDSSASMRRRRRDSRTFSSDYSMTMSRRNRTNSGQSSRSNVQNTSIRPSSLESYASKRKQMAEF